MKDDKGTYYYPFPDNKQVRMYVREEEGEIFFRLYNAKDPQLWEEHGWKPYGAIQQAAAMYRKKDFDPTRAYDIDIAREVIRENTPS